MANYIPTKREESLLPGGRPKYVRCYDNGGETLDRYTVVFTGRYRHKTGGEFWHLGMNSQPFHGIGQHGQSDTQIDYPAYAHLGRKIAFGDLPEDCRRLVLQTYCYLWDIRDPATGEVPDD